MPMWADTILRYISSHVFTNFKSTKLLQKFHEIFFVLFFCEVEFSIEIKIDHKWQCKSLFDQWYFVTKIVRKNCSRDQENLLKFKAVGQEFTNV